MADGMQRRSYIPLDDSMSSEFVHIIHDHELELRNQLYKQWQDCSNCDLVLRLKGGEIHAHSCVVSAFSPKLKNLLENSTRHTPGIDKLHLRILLDIGVMRYLLNMIYTGVLSFNTTMLPSIMEAAKWLEMEDIVKICQNYQQDTCIKYDAAEILVEHKTLNTDEYHSHDAPISCKPTADHRSRRKRGESAYHSDPLKEKSTKKGKSKLSKSQMAENLLNLSDAFTIVVEKEELIQEDVPLENSSWTSEGLLNIRKPRGQQYTSKTLQIDDPVKEKQNTQKKRGRPSAPRNISITPVIKSESQSLENVIEAQKDEVIKKHLQMVILPENLMSHTVKTEAELLDTDTPQRDGAMESFNSALVLHNSWTDDDSFEKSENSELDFILGKTDHISCKKCLSKFTKVEEYNEHILNHPTFSCDACNITYYRKSNLTRHMRTSHFSKHHLSCRRCDFVAKTESELRSHCKAIHNETKPFLCEHPGCTYKTWKFDFLNRHVEIHCEVKRYICDKCGQGFSQHAGLISHHRACYHLQQFLCDLCGQSFNHVQSMRAHRRTIHYGEKPFCCKVCGNNFSDQRNLKRHMLIHNNAFPYQCLICKQKYRHSNSLRAHLKKHGESGFNVTIIGNLRATYPTSPHSENQNINEMLNSRIEDLQSSENPHPSADSEILIKAGVEKNCNTNIPNNTGGNVSLSDISEMESHSDDMCLKSRKKNGNGCNRDSESIVIFPGSMSIDLEDRELPRLETSGCLTPHSDSSIVSPSLQDCSDVSVGKENRTFICIDSSASLEVDSKNHVATNLSHNSNLVQSSDDTRCGNVVNQDKHKISKMPSLDVGRHLYGLRSSAKIDLMEHTPCTSDAAITPQLESNTFPEGEKVSSIHLMYTSGLTMSADSRSLENNLCDLNSSESSSFSPLARSLFGISATNGSSYSTTTRVTHPTTPTNISNIKIRDVPLRGSQLSSDGSGTATDSGTESNGQPHYGLETLAEICFNSSL